MIILVYPKYVGGKFISNCLALSRHCVVQDYRTATLDIKLGQRGYDDAYYKFKLASVMKTLPLKQDMANWGLYEYGCDKLYDIGEEFYKDNYIDAIKGYVKADSSGIYAALKSAHRESCLITHDYRTLMKYLRVWPDARIIEFTNYNKFRAVAAKLKTGSADFKVTQTPEYQQSSGYYHQDQDFYKLDSDFILAIDELFSRWDVFDNSMKRVYRRFGFDDYHEDNMKMFFEAYMSLHQ